VNGELASAYAHCQRLARQHYENFPVASFLLPARARPHIAAVYAFARRADDMADEGDRPQAARLADLDAWGEGLRVAASGHVSLSDPDALVFVALANTIRECRLPVSLLDDLVSAFRQDVTVTRYATWADVLDYCRRSANPVGRLVLRIMGYDDPSLGVLSDAVCTALQLTNFWQDLAIDWQRGRLYLPADIWQPAGAQGADLDAKRITVAWQSALADAANRTRRLFDIGRPVCDSVRGRLRWELRATWLGGTRILEKLEAGHFDVFTSRPSLTAADAPALTWRMMLWNRVKFEVASR
jgi:squalene synthase HpnC